MVIHGEELTDWNPNKAVTQPVSDNRASALPFSGKEIICFSWYLVYRYLDIWKICALIMKEKYAIADYVSYQAMIQCKGVWLRLFEMVFNIKKVVNSSCKTFKGNNACQQKIWSSRKLLVVQQIVSSFHTRLCNTVLNPPESDIKQQRIQRISQCILQVGQHKVMQYL